MEILEEFLFYHRNKVENWQKAVRLSEVGAVDMPSTARLDIFAGNAAKSICFRNAKARYVTDGSNLEPSVTMVNEKEVSFWADFHFVYHSQGTVGVSPNEAVIISSAVVISIEGA